MVKKKPAFWLKWLGLPIFAFSLLANIYQFINYKFTDNSILVLEVIDGDTILLDGKVKLRLRHLDAPEIDNCKGKQAKEFLERLVKGEKIIIQEKILDQRGRPLALIYLGNVLVNQRILEAGLARYHHDQTTQEDLLKQIGLEVKAEKIGIYSPECYQKDKNLENPQCIIKGNMDVNDSSIKRYHFPGCAQYDFAIVEKDKGEQWFCTEAEAKEAGYVKSKRCPDKKFQPPSD